MKRVTRNRARVSYYEPEEPSFDEYIFCSSCRDYVYEYCSIHGSLLVIPDEEIFDGNHKPGHILDARDANKSNWMRYVNCSRHHSEQNLVAYQYWGQLYYRTTRIIPRFTELLVFYGSEFASRLDIDVRRYHSPAFADILVNGENGAQKSKSHEDNNDTTADEKDNPLNYIINESNCDTNVQSSESIVVNLTNLNEKIGDKIEGNKGQHDNYVCNDCGQSFNEKPAIIDHIATHRTVKNADNITVSKTKVSEYACSSCNSTFATKSGLINHEIKMHGSKIKCKACTECDFKTVYNYNLKRHMDIHSGFRIRGYKCNICTYAAFTNEDLKRHANTHMQENTYSCQKCGLKFNNKIKLTVHSTIHEADRLYSCTICGYRSKRNYDLKRHTVVVHSEEKPFTCMICNESFKTRNTLMRHSKFHGAN